MSEQVLWTSKNERYQISLHESERVMLIDNDLSYTDWPILTGTGVAYDRPELWPQYVKEKARAFLWQLNEPDPDPITEPQIWQAWDELGDDGPDEGRWSATFEHGQWWVTGYDSDDERHSYSVVEASGPGSAYGLSFEEV